MTAALAVLAGVVAAVGVAPPATAGVSPGQTLRVSVGSDQAESTASSVNPAVSGDGRWVVFSSRAQLDTQAAPDDSPSPQIYVRDLVDDTTRLLSFTYAGEGEGTQAVPVSGTSDFPAISDDGRYVAFQTNAALAGGTAGREKIIFVDRDPDGDAVLDEPLGDTISLTYTLVSDSTGELPPHAFRPSMSDDGLTIAFETFTAGQGPVMVATMAPTATPGLYTASRRAIRPLLPEPGLNFAYAYGIDISGDGKRIVAMANYVNPPPPVPSGPVVRFAPAGPAPAGPPPVGPAPVRPAAAAAQVAPVPGERVVGFDLAAANSSTGNVTVLRLDVTAAGAPIGLHLGGNEPQISSDGRSVVFEVSVAQPCGGCEIPDVDPQAYIVDPDPDGDGTIGPETAVDTLSRDNAGQEIRAIMPAISGDGRYAAFVTDVPLSHNGLEAPPGDVECATERGSVVEFGMAAQSLSNCQVVVRDLVLDKNRAASDLARLPGELASPGVDALCVADPLPTDSCASDGISLVPALSSDGGVVVYTSDAADLVPDDDNNLSDVFARRFTPTVLSDPVDFGGVQLGDSATIGTVVTPVGFGPLAVESVTVTGGAFTLDLTTCAGTLHVEDTCAVTIDFTPPTEGTHTGSLDIKPAFVGAVPIPVTGIGTPFPQPDPAFEIDPRPLDFGERLILTDSGPGAVTVTNGGTRVINVGAVSLPALPEPSASGDYRITANTCTGALLDPGETCTVTLVHQPLGPGARPAVLQIDQAVPGPAIQPHLVELLGAGTQPRLQMNPAVVPVGRITNVIGTGFPPNRTVSVRMPGFPELVQFGTGPDGTFTEAMLIYPNSVPGSRVVEVTVDGTAPAVGDAENLLVVPGTLGPPDFLVRR